MEKDMYINTNLFSRRATNVLEPMLNYMSTIHHHYSWRYIGRYFNIENSPSNEIVFHTKSSSLYSQYKDDFKTRIANIIKTIVIEHHGIWDRNTDSTFKMTFTSRHSYDNVSYTIPIKDIYFIYDYLKDRKNLNNKYDVEYIKEMIGDEADPITTEMRKTIAQEKNNIMREYEERCQNANNTYSKIINDAYAKAHAYRDNEYDKAKEERDEKLKELENNLANMKSFC